MSNIEIHYHRYMCHPETCSHENHYSWWVTDKASFTVIGKFETKQGAIAYCEDRGLKFKLKLPQWSDY